MYPKRIPSNGDRNIAPKTFVRNIAHGTASFPYRNIAGPIIPPTKEKVALVGSLKSHASRFTIIAPMIPLRISVRDPIV